MSKDTITKSNRKFALQESKIGSEVIVDNVILYDNKVFTLISYFGNI